jgi:hypothetical protein
MNNLITLEGVPDYNFENNSFTDFRKNYGKQRNKG